MLDILAGLQTELRQLRPMARLGRVAEVAGGTLRLTGLGDVAALGDRVEVTAAPGPFRADVIAMTTTDLIVLPDGPATGIRIGDPVLHLGAVTLCPDDGWIGRVIDPYGRPLDGRPLLPGPQTRSLQAAPPSAAQRRRLGERLETGMTAFDTLLPLVRGQRIGLFAGSGVGKSSLLARFARGVQADVVVIALIGERGRELRDFVERTLGPAGMARSVIIAATSDQSALTRRRCALAAMVVAEHFRDRGRHVLFLADSVTRFAEAHREIALAGGEAASMQGYPPSLAPAIMGLAERAGPGPDREAAGDITAIFSVLVAGSDMEEPVADILRGTLDGHVLLDRQIAERGRFPAVDILRSVSRSLPEAASEPENALIGEARRLLSVWDKAELMVQSGLYTKGADPVIDRAADRFPVLDAFLAETAPENGTAGSFDRLRHALGPQRA